MSRKAVYSLVVLVSIIGSVLVAPFARLSSAQAPPRTPLIFIPGMTGSILEEAGGGVLWPGWSQLFTDYDKLTLDPAKQQYPVIATDAFRDILSLVQIYKPLLNMLVTQGGYREYHVNDDPRRRTAVGCDDANQRANAPTLFVFAYDWRKSNGENARLLHDYVGCIRKFYPGTKVDLLGHSMGGLVGRSYVLQYPGNVRKLISIGTPWLGAPKATYILETGAYGAPVTTVLITESKLKELAEFFPGLHQLLPSRAYFALGAAPFYERGWDINGDGSSSTTYTYNQFVNLLDRRHPRSLPGTADRVFHDLAGQDDWRSDQSGVQYYHIHGVQSRNATIGAVRAVKKVTCILIFCETEYVFELDYTQGDGTVPSLSGTRIGAGQNLNAASAILKAFSGPNDDAVEHLGLTKNGDVHSYILAVLNSTQAPLQSDEAEVVSPAKPAYYLQVRNVASPVLQDVRGNSTAAAEHPVPGLIYNQFGAQGVQLVLPPDQTYIFTFRTSQRPIVLELKRGTDTQTTYAVRYQDLVLPANRQAQLLITPQGAEAIRYDANGDEVLDTSVVPTVAVEGNDAQDVTPPDVFVSTSGAAASPVVTITASDVGSGVRSLLYSLDGHRYQRYAGPFQVDPRQTEAIFAFADDNLANRSALVTYALPTLVYLPMVGAR